jgi:hypothetical protein
VAAGSSWATTTEGTGASGSLHKGPRQVSGSPLTGFEYVERGGRFYVCPVCVKVRGLEDATWTKNAEVKGAPSLYEFTAGGALVFNY